MHTLKLMTYVEHACFIEVTKLLAYLWDFFWQIHKKLSRYGELASLFHFFYIIGWVIGGEGRMNDKILLILNHEWLWVIHFLYKYRCNLVFLYHIFQFLDSNFFRKLSYWQIVLYNSNFQTARLLSTLDFSYNFSFLLISCD